MFLKGLLEAASPRLFADRLLSITDGDDDSETSGGGKPKEDDDLSGEPDDDDEDAGKDEDKEQGKDEGKETDDEAALLAKYDEDLNEEEKTYKQRFSDTKADRDDLARQLRAKITENEELRKKTGKAPLYENAEDEEKAVQALFDDIWGEISTIKDEDANERLKKVYRTIAKKMVHGQKQAVEAALSKIKVEQTATTEQQQQAAMRREQATKGAKIALKEIGLDPEKHFPLIQREVDKQMETEKEWFSVIPVDQQFIRLAERVKKRLDKINGERDEHRQSAAGTMGAGGRRRPAPKDKDEGGEDDSMAGAMAIHSRKLRENSGKLYAINSGRRAS